MTKQRDLIFEWICHYKRENNGTNPSLVEIAQYFGITPAGARSHVMWLIVDGKLEKHPRSFLVPMSEWDLVD